MIRAYNKESGKRMCFPDNGFRVAKLCDPNWIEEAQPSSLSGPNPPAEVLAQIKTLKYTKGKIKAIATKTKKTEK